jgi:cytidine deaminase
MREFGDQLEVFLVDPSGEYTLTSIKELLPAAFAPGDI